MSILAFTGVMGGLALDITGQVINAAVYPKTQFNKDRLYIALYARGGAPTMPGKEDT